LQLQPDMFKFEGNSHRSVNVYQTCACSILAYLVGSVKKGCF
jgi:hypothetical protein